MNLSEGTRKEIEQTSQGNNQQKYRKQKLCFESNNPDANSTSFRIGTDKRESKRNVSVDIMRI